MEPCQVCALPPLPDAGSALLAEHVGRLALQKGAVEQRGSPLDTNRTRSRHPRP
jgi:hypothetical protein